MAYTLTDIERETVINYNAGEKMASVFTWSKKLQAELSANPDAVLRAQGQHRADSPDRWMKFDVPRSLVKIRRRRVLSDERRRAMADHARAVLVAP